MSFSETLIILLVAMIVLGPRRLPEAARKIGHWMGVVRRAGDEFKRQLMAMDQGVQDRLNTATGDLEKLVPTDEELGAEIDRAVTEAEQAYDSLNLPPPAASPDDAWGAAPVPGGLPHEEPPTPSPEAKPAATSAAEKPAAKPSAPASAAPKRTSGKPLAPRSLGLSPTPPEAKEARRG